MVHGYISIHNYMFVFILYEDKYRRFKLATFDLQAASLLTAFRVLFLTLVQYSTISERFYIFNSWKLDQVSVSKERIISGISALEYKGFNWSFINAPWENSMIGTQTMSTKKGNKFAYAGWKLKIVIS